MANKLTDKIKETVKTMPVAVRWLLLVAAFVVVLILLLLLINKPKHTNSSGLNSNKDVSLIITPDTADFSGTQIGTKKTQVFQINATSAVVVDSVSLQDQIAGFTAKTASCKDQEINKNIPCKIEVNFAPGSDDITTKAVLLVNWHDKNDSKDLNQKTDQIVIPVSVKSSKKEIIQPEPIVIPEPIPEPEPEPEYEPEPEPEPIVGGDRNIFEQPEPIEEKPEKRAQEKCSDFAMAGYNMSGTQIGWIKPKNGRYEFHPFSDTECNKPTGTYNPDTGMITDERGKKIGTDSDHVGASVNMNSIPKLRSKPGAITSRSSVQEEKKSAGMGNLKNTFSNPRGDENNYLHFEKNTIDKEALAGSAEEIESVYSSRPYDRTFILRQFKPIPATIVSEVRADPSVYGCNLETNECKDGTGIPVRATVDRNVYSDNGRTIIIPTGTLLMGYLTGELPGPYKSIGRMKIKWYQFIRPDGVEFNFADGQDPYSADSQGRVGVPGYGSTDYVEQMVMPLLTAVIPAAVNMISPIADSFVNQIDLDNNTVVQSGTVRSSELAKNEVISAWNQIAQKLIVDTLDNTVPPFSIAAGTRITVYSPVDLIATCGDEAADTANAGKKCAFHEYGQSKRRNWSSVQNGKVTVNGKDSSWTGQVRGFNLSKFCTQENNVWTVDDTQLQAINESGYEYRTVLAYCQAQNYQATNQAKYETYYQNKVTSGIQGVTSDGTVGKLTKDTKEYNEQVLGLTYDDNGNIKNPFEQAPATTTEVVDSLLCNDGTAPDANGCCTGETYTEMGADSEIPFACCPETGDCYPPMEMN